MAQKTVIQLIDDLDGSEAQGTVSFGLDGTAYEIELSQVHAAELREAVAPYLAAARRVGRVSGRRTSVRPVAATAPARPTRPDREQVAAIREWARGQGYEVKNRGRIPGAVMEAYNASTAEPAPKPEAPAKAAKAGPAKAAKAPAKATRRRQRRAVKS
jgi:Lsr2